MITGGASGLGLAACERFAAEGATVVCVDLSEEAAQEVADRLPGQAVGVGADVCEPAAMVRAVESARAAVGDIDVLFANAGVSGEGAAHDMPLEQWRRVISTNLDGVFFSVRAVLPGMMERRSGSLILQSSAAGLKGMANLASYSAAKAGVLGLMRQLAVEYAPYGIRCNAICPGTIATPLVEEAYRQRFGDGGAAEAIARRGADYPLGRLGAPSDVASYAVYLASDESAWVTGTEQAIDGGLVARL
ncbi:MAG: glucose 1-dehydrogenase [Frankiales bacterium]|nr:glucose 1-dehydrogenase [Frankiales bacterium]